MESAGLTPPATIPVNIDGIPEYLKGLNQWLMWQWVRNGERWDKVPMQINGRAGKSNDPSTWNTFENVIEAYKTTRFSGIGFALAPSDGCAVIDIDHGYKDGILQPWAAEILGKFPATTFKERSVRDGAHIWILSAPLDTNLFKRTKELPEEGDECKVEFFDGTSNRYICITGVKP